jgi:exosortase C (VPDSG-CTERM-specific)
MDDRVEVQRRSTGLSRLHSYVLFAAVLTAAFGRPLFQLAQIAYDNALVSHTVLVPAASAYLIWLRRGQLLKAPSGAQWPGTILLVVALAVLSSPWPVNEGVVGSTPDNRLAVQVLAYCLMLCSAGFFMFGAKNMKVCLFPVCFLFFMVPLPPAVVENLEIGLQRSSAEAAFAMIKTTGTPVFRQGLIFWLPGIGIEVARECSGIHSSLVLFITALVAGDLFLKARWTRLLIAVIVVPLGILRNGFRILVLSMLTVHVDPSYIDSPLHHEGGPIFFALSLIPFFLMLGALRRIEIKRLADLGL